jgi:hypothetical protein
MDESRARQLVLVQAFDAADTPQWTPEDREWASRLAAQTAPPDATPEQLLAERAHHALQRLAPRDAGVRRWLERSPWRWGWLAAALAAGAIAGLTADLLGREPHINLLAPPVWAVVAWNGVVYALLIAQAVRGKTGSGVLRRLLERLWRRAVGRGPLQRAGVRWAAVSAGLTRTRVALLLHLGAAALAGGVVAGLYLRGLVFDYRVAWQSTFLEPATVHAALSLGMAPASALTGIAVPDVAAIAAMRITPLEPQAAVGAAPWIHLYAATLLLAVVLPRLVLTLAALGQAIARARTISLPITDDPALAPMRRHQRRGAAFVRVLPYAAAPGAQAALGLRALLATSHGDDVQLQMAEVTPVGEEEAAAARATQGTPALLVALTELGATPEAEHHGRFVQALRTAAPGVPLLWVVDETVFARRFAGMPARVAERRALWHTWTQGERLRCLCVDLEAPPTDASKAALDEALAA